jgi:RecB family exonuclease
LRTQVSKEGTSLVRRFGLPGFHSCWNYQIKHLQEGLQGALLVVKVGRYAESPLSQDAEQLELRKGLPWRRLSEIIDRAVEKDLNIAVAVELRNQTGRIKPRRLAYFVEPIKRLSPPGKRLEKQKQLDFFD